MAHAARPDELPTKPKGQSAHVDELEAAREGEAVPGRHAEHTSTCFTTRVWRERFGIEDVRIKLLFFLRNFLYASLGFQIKVLKIFQAFKTLNNPARSPFRPKYQAGVP